jgi:hypothetical protein
LASELTRHGQKLSILKHIAAHVPYTLGRALEHEVQGLRIPLGLVVAFGLCACEHPLVGRVERDFDKRLAF